MKNPGPCDPGVLGCEWSSRDAALWRHGRAARATLGSRRVARSLCQFFLRLAFAAVRFQRLEVQVLFAAFDFGVFDGGFDQGFALEAAAEDLFAERVFEVRFDGLAG